MSLYLSDEKKRQSKGQLLVLEGKICEAEICKVILVDALHVLLGGWCDDSLLLGEVCVKIVHVTLVFLSRDETILDMNQYKLYIGRCPIQQVYNTVSIHLHVVYGSKT